MPGVNVHTCRFKLTGMAAGSTKQLAWLTSEHVHFWGYPEPFGVLRGSPA